MEHNDNALGKLVRTYRLKKGLTQMQLAEKAGFSQRGISYIERGTSEQPRPDGLRHIARVLGIPWEEITQAASRSAGNVPFDDYFPEDAVSPELRASFRSLSQLSPKRMRQVQEMIDAFSAMDDAEFQKKAK